MRVKRKTKLMQVLGIIAVAGAISSVWFDAERVSAYSASLTTSSSVAIDAMVSNDGTTIQSESINVQSDCRNGYNLTIATPEGSNLYRYDNGSQSSTNASFTAVDGTSALNSNNNTNKWGYTLTSNPTSSTIFSPLSSTASVLKTPSQTASTTDINDTFNINYGIKIDNSVAPGTYQMANNGTVVYYLTMDTTCTQYTVNFNANGGTGSMDNQVIEAGESTELSANSFTAPAQGSSYTDAAGHTIPGDTYTYWSFAGWNTEIDGSGVSYKDKESITDITSAGRTITLYAQWEPKQLMLVNFSGNGMQFEGGATTNTVGYHNSCSTKYLSAPSYSHTANIGDDGTGIGSTTYANNLATKDVVTIPGASSLHATIKYGTENNYDMLYVFEGEYTGSVTRNMSAGQLAKYMGGNNSVNTVELDITGDTATFAFYSDGSGVYWGYHVTLVGYYDEEPASYASTAEVCTRELLTGSYKEPVAESGKQFKGWTENESAPSLDYVSADDILNSLPGSNGSTINLYAYWLPQYKITYVDNCKSWASSDTNCTDTKSATTSEQMINLANNPSTGTETGTLGAYNKFTMTGWKIKEWTTNADGTGSAYPAASTYTVPAGSGVGSGIILYAHWVPIYTVQYDGNGADNSSTGMGSTDPSTGIKAVNHTNVAEGDTFDLFASNFKRAGYGFVGWSTDANAWSKLTDNDTANDAKIWGPNEIITAPASNGTPITTLYAIWAPAETDGGNPVYLQNWTGCSAMTATTYDTTTGKLTVSKNSITALTDERDGNVYTIAKLADENCWMVENLRLADTHEDNGNTVATTLTTANTNISTTNNTLPITNIYNADSSLATKSNSLSPSSSQSITDDANYGWCTNNSAACNDQSRLNTTNSTWNNNTASAVTPSKTQSITSTNAHSDFNNYVYSYGNYYNWYSATAGYGTYSRNTNQPTDGDLCPAGWKLPYGNTGTSGSNIGGTKGGFSFLDKQMDGTGVYQGTSAASNKWRTFPNNFIYSGSWYGGSANYRGNNGRYWSASANGPLSAYYLGLDSISVLPGNYSNNKYVGYSVRCVAGTYTPANTVTYMPNGSDVEGTMANQTISSTATSIDLYPSNFSRAGYGFAGWNTKADGTGTNYGPMETISITAGQYNVEGLRLYANWIESEGSLQNWTGCSAMNQGDVTALTDQRDNDTYAVAKLADGKCWMIENLRLDNTGTNNTTGALAQGYNSSFIGLAEPEAPWADNSTDTNSLYTTETGVSGKQTISGSDIGYRFPRYNSQNTSSRADTTTNSTNIYSYGNYYTWPAAIADTTEHDINKHSVENTSICPKGWRLPKDGDSANATNSDFWQLGLGIMGFAPELNRYGSKTNAAGKTATAAIRSYPNNFVYSGYVDIDSVFGRGEYGYYWSSTVSLSHNAYSMYFYSSEVYPGTGSISTYSGRSIRCIAGS